jgi:hypothetical protein
MPFYALLLQQSKHYRALEFACDTDIASAMTHIAIGSICHAPWPLSYHILINPIQKESLGYSHRIKPEYGCGD